MCPTRPPAGTPEADGLSSFGLSRESRIRRGGEIRTLLDRGKRKRTSSLDVFFMPSPVARPRFGLIVPRHRHRIVDRNRLKRRLREIGRLHVLPRFRESDLDIDLIVRARSSAYEGDFQQLKDEVMRAVEGICSGER